MTASSPLPIVVLISGGGSNLQAIIDAIHNQQLNAEIKAVISNNPDAFGLQRARATHIETRVIDHRDYSDRHAFDMALQTAIDTFQPALVVLAGFMRIFTDEFVEHYRGRMLNIHPSLLPKFQGLHTHQRAIEAKETEHGATVHFVTPELDGGPAILQARVPVLTGDTTDLLAQRVLHFEHQIYPQVISWFAAGRLSMQDGRAVFDGQSLKEPLQFPVD